MLASLARTGVAVTAEEHRKAGGLADAIRTVAAEQYPVPILAVGVDDTFGVSGTGEAVMERFGLTAAGIADTVRQALVLKPVVRHSPVLDGDECQRSADCRLPSRELRQRSDPPHRNCRLFSSPVKMPCSWRPSTRPWTPRRAALLPDAGAHARRPAARRDRRLPRRQRRARRRLARDRAGRVRLPRRADRLRQVHLHPAADAGDRRLPGPGADRRAATSAQLPRKKVPKLRRNIGVVFQDYKLLPNRTVYDNVAYSLQVIGASRSSIRAKVPEILRLVGLSTKLHDYPDELSGGEQQRVSLARAFVNHPPLLLADEPTGNLDPETSIGIMQLLYRINRTGTTVIVATHDSEMVDQMRRRVIELSEGRVVRDEHAGSTGRWHREFDARSRAQSNGVDEALLPAGGAARAAAQRRAEPGGVRDRADHDARAGRLHPGRARGDREDQRGAQQDRARGLHQRRRDARPRSHELGNMIRDIRHVEQHRSSSARPRRCGS